LRLIVSRIRSSLIVSWIRLTGKWIQDTLPHLFVRSLSLTLQKESNVR
jgi:hypothetical protein